MLVMYGDTNNRVLRENNTVNCSEILDTPPWVFLKGKMGILQIVVQGIMRP